MEVFIYSLLKSALDVTDWSALGTDRSTSGSQWTDSWMGSRDVLLAWSGDNLLPHR